jgi:hypothetical protein
MLGARRKIPWRSLRRRLAAAVTLCAYLAAALGLPLPASPPREKGQPFPCMDHPCGCQTAEQCWTSCCCLTAEERWAWARAHNVQPPAYAERPAAADQGWSTTPLRDQAEGKTPPHGRGACCRSEKSCRADSARDRGCCQPSTSPSSDKADNARGGVRWVLGVSAQRCQGLTTLWVSTGTTLPPPRVVAWAPSADPAGWLSSTDTTAFLLSRTPPAPPPR